MNLIDETTLFYSPEEEIALDYIYADWKKIGKHIFEEYDDPETSWEHFKRETRIIFGSEFLGEISEDDVKNLLHENIQADLFLHRLPEWSDNLKDYKLTENKGWDGYITKREIEEQEKTDFESSLSPSDEIIKCNVEYLREKGFDERVIEIFYPQGIPFLEVTE